MKQMLDVGGRGFLCNKELYAAQILIEEMATNCINGVPRGTIRVKANGIYVIDALTALATQVVIITNSHVLWNTYEIVTIINIIVTKNISYHNQYKYKCQLVFSNTKTLIFVAKQ